MRQMLLLVLGVVVRVLAYVAVVRVADAIAGTSGLYGLMVGLALLGLLELGPLRWTDRATGVAQWRRRRWNPGRADSGAADSNAGS
jgi:hypothetical protein